MVWTRRNVSGRGSRISARATTKGDLQQEAQLLRARSTEVFPFRPAFMSKQNRSVLKSMRSNFGWRAAQLTCHACSCVLQEVQCGTTDAMPQEAAAVRRHASTEASTKTHTANAAELPDVSVSWKSVAQAWIDEVSADSICHTFELGGTIAALGGVAFVRNGITVSFLLHDVLERKLSVVQLVKDSRPRPNHLSLASRTNLAKLFGHTAPDVVPEISSACSGTGSKRGLCAVLSSDNSLVLFRLRPSQNGSCRRR